MLKLGSWSTIARFGAIAGESQGAHRVRPGAHSCATMLTVFGPSTCSRPDPQFEDALRGGVYCPRELVHVNVTANPTDALVRRQVIEATP
jgi:hypothetical protein